MLKDLSGKVVPHPTEYLVMVGDRVSPITKQIAYTSVAQFVHKSHAEAFAKSITSFHTAVIDPEIPHMLRAVGLRVTRKCVHGHHIGNNRTCTLCETEPKGWDA